jgi:hypothetical protein
VQWRVYSGIGVNIFSYSVRFRSLCLQFSAADINRNSFHHLNFVKIDVVKAVFYFGAGGGGDKRICNRRMRRTIRRANSDRGKIDFCFPKNLTQAPGGTTQVVCGGEGGVKVTVAWSWPLRQMSRLRISGTILLVLVGPSWRGQAQLHHFSFQIGCLNWVKFCLIDVCKTMFGIFEFCGTLCTKGRSFVAGVT